MARVASIGGLLDMNQVNLSKIKTDGTMSLL